MGLKDLDRMKVRQEYRNEWHEDLMSTMTADPGFCCFACCCPYCASFTLRKRALYDDMSRYRCCGGYMPCSGRCGERHCPTCCLCCEVVCCFGTSVSSTRYIIQDEFNIKTTGCDNCIIGCMVCLQSLSCLCCIIACLTGSDEINDIAECLSCIAETVYCSVCACMQTQHRIELNKRDGKLDTQQPVMAAPQAQQMSRSVADATGYPPQASPPPMGYPHPPPAYMHPPAPYGHHDPYAPVAYHGQHAPYPPHMYQPHASYAPAHPPAPAYPAGPPSGLYDSGMMPAGPESGPYPPSRPRAPPPPPGFNAEAPSSPLPPLKEHHETGHPSSNPPR